MARFHKASAGRNLMVESEKNWSPRVSNAHIWMRKPWNWQRCESPPARTPDCDIKVATLHKVFLPAVRESVYFCLGKDSRGEVEIGSERRPRRVLRLHVREGAKRVQKQTYPHDA